MIAKASHEYLMSAKHCPSNHSWFVNCLRHHGEKKSLENGEPDATSQRSRDLRRIDRLAHRLASRARARTRCSGKFELLLTLCFSLKIRVTNKTSVVYIQTGDVTELLISHPVIERFTITGLNVEQ